MRSRFRWTVSGGSPVKIVTLCSLKRPLRVPLARGAVVADEHEQERVVELAGLLEEVDDPTDLGVGVLHVAGVDLGHPSEQLLLVRRQVVPGRHALEHRRQLRRLGDDAQLLLPGQGLLPVGVPPHVELALVAVGPLRPDMMRRMHRPEGEVGQPRLLRGDRLVLSDPADRLVGKVLREVVAVLRQPGLVDRLSVHEQLRVPLVRVAAEEAVEPVEAEHRTDWPPVVRPRDTRLLRRRVVPLPQAEARVAVLVQHRGDAGLVLWLAGVVAGEATRQLGDVRHAHRMVIAARDQARPCRRAQRRRRAA
jgi:hypothetical protein